jgi:hypothetical protein
VSAQQIAADFSVVAAWEVMPLIRNLDDAAEIFSQIRDRVEAAMVEALRVQAFEAQVSHE